MKDVKGNRQVLRLREQLAQEAAKIMAEQMIRDYQQARRKACDRLGYKGKQALPGNDEIHAALESYLQLFKGDTQHQVIGGLRQVALEAMRFLSEFKPRLVGAVLNGTADKYSAVHLHVFSESEEQILRFLMDNQIDYDLIGAAVNYGGDRQQQITRCKFMADDTPIELSLFNLLGLREAPRSPIDGKPMRRADLAAVEELLNLYKLNHGGHGEHGVI